MPAPIIFQVDPEHQFHRLPAVRARYDVSTSTLFRWMSEGRFPKSESLGPNTRAWRESVLREFDADPQGWAEKNKNNGVKNELS
jgi:predicted DNA-binding transcriptional regulator AlpA